MAMLFVTSAFGQKLTVTPNGLRDSSDNEKTFVVLETGDMTAKQLYDNSIKYITENYKNPKEVIKGQTESEYLKFDTYVSEFLRYNNSGVKIPIQANYTVELRFKDGKVRYEVISLDMTAKSSNYRVLFSGGLLEGYIIYKNNGKLFKEETKEDIENYFNAEIERLTKFIKGETKKSDW
jgi:hypothetical protein